MNKNTPAQESLQLATPDGGATNVEKYEFEPIKGYPMLNCKRAVIPPLKALG